MPKKMKGYSILTHFWDKLPIPKGVRFVASTTLSNTTSIFKIYE